MDAKGRASWWPSRRELNLPIRYVGVGRKGGRPVGRSTREIHRIVVGKMNPEYMREALDLARKGRGLTQSHPMVGAVLVRDGEVVGRGFHTYAGLWHAEAAAAGGSRARRARRHAFTSTLNRAPTGTNAGLAASGPNRGWGGGVGGLRHRRP